MTPSTEEIASWLERDFGLLGALSIERCLGGFENEVFKVLVSTGQCLGLRIYRYRTVDEIKFELLVLDALRISAIARVFCPSVIRSRSGEYINTLCSRPCIVYHWIDGRQTDEIGPDLIRDLAKFLPEMQRAASHLVNIRSSGTTQRNYDPERITKMAEEIINARELGKFRNAVGDGLKWYQENSLLLRVADKVLVHGDLNPSNLLVRNGRLHGVLDFDDCYVGSALMDVGVVTLHSAFGRDNQFCDLRFAKTMSVFSEDLLQDLSVTDTLVLIACVAYKYLICVAHTDIFRIGSIRSATVLTKYQHRFQYILDRLQAKSPAFCQKNYPRLKN